MPSGSSGTGARASGSWPFASNKISLSTLFYLSLAFSSSVFAQNDVRLRPSAASDSFPSCGLNCPDLQQADDSCTPPAAAVTNRQTYVSCFCQSSLLVSWQSSIDSICTGTCTSSQDRQTLQTWYSDFCQSGGDTTEDSNDNNSNNNPGNNNNNNSNNNNNNNNNNNDNSNANSEADNSGSSAANRKPAPQSWSVGWPLEMGSHGNRPRCRIHDHRHRRHLA
ncbi:uncharacterized protein BDV17DRAFT_77085 [Aspergillus undulatus]|uniref:uncharacterized protein n=1 Tax=Aspergillus undulatus TaxID=1810928 RepID=UPI003CCD6FEF